MAPPLARRSLVVTALVTAVASGLLAGCGGWWRQHQRAQQRREAQERCIEQRATLTQLIGAIEADQRALKTLTEQVYTPTRRPPPPDPELADRFSQLDRELDQERYLKQSAAWNASEAERRRLWEQGQLERQQRVRQRLDARLQELTKVDPALVIGGQPNRSAIARRTLCPDP